MTCVIALKDGDKIWMGGDSASCAGDSRLLAQNQKIFKNGEYMIGFSGSWRMGQVLQYDFEPPTRADFYGIHDDMKFMVSVFILALMECFKNHKIESNTSGGQNSTCGMIIVSAFGKIFLIDDDYHVLECIDEFACIGSGFNSAAASLHTSLQLAKRDRRLIDPLGMLQLALETSERYTTTVSRPFYCIDSASENVHYV